MTLTRSLQSLLLRRTRLLSSSTTTSTKVTKSKPGRKQEAPPSPSPSPSPSPTPLMERKEKVMKPMEVPWQAKVSNNVHLVGYVGEELTSVTSKDGVLNAVSFLVHNEDNVVPRFWIPIIFRGELAETAILHVKENDRVYITGELSTNRSEFKEADKDSSHQVIVHSINFVKELIPKEQRQETHIEMDVIADQSENHSKKPQSPSQNPWQDLVDKPEDWMDYRMQKREGVVKPRHPDFKNKYSRVALWSSGFPEWVLRKVGSLSFADPGSPASGRVQSSTSSSSSSDEELLWDDLLKNPHGWYDNRSTKAKPTYPDFKQKETGKGLWIGPKTPSWVLTSLPPPHPKA